MSQRPLQPAHPWRPLRLAAGALLLFGTGLMLTALALSTTALHGAAFGLVMLGLPTAGIGAVLWWVEAVDAASRLGDRSHHRRRGTGGSRRRRGRSNDGSTTRFTSSMMMSPSELGLEDAAGLSTIETAWARRTAPVVTTPSRAASPPPAWTAPPPPPSPPPQVVSPGGNALLRSSARTAPPLPPPPSAAPAPPRRPDHGVSLPVLDTPLAPSEVGAVYAGDETADAAPPPTAGSRAGSVPERDGNAALVAALHQPGVFEHVVEALYRQAGFRVRVQPHAGEQGGMHLWLYSRHHHGPAVSVVRCERDHGREPLSDAPLRALTAVMMAHGARRGHFVNAAGFTGLARDYAQRHGIHLLDLPALHMLIQARSPQQQRQLLQAIQQQAGRGANPQDGAAEGGPRSHPGAAPGGAAAFDPTRSGSGLGSRRHGHTR